MNRTSRTLPALYFRALLSLLFLSLPACLLAQGTTATVSGFITDASGAKLPNATVTYTNSATGVSGTATTNGDGLYRVGGLLPGAYDATVTMQGFKTSVKKGIDLQIEDQVTLNYSLDVGAASETVTVNADANVLETSSPTVSQVIEGRQVEDTPLNGRNTMNLVALTPGVVPQGGTSGAGANNAGGGAFTNANSFGNYQIAGGLSGESSFYIDGAPINADFGNAVGFIITQDAVQEFRVESSVVNPAYGRFGGGVVTFATKPGGNRLHGSLYEYFRNTIFDANLFFNNLNGLPRPKFDQNQFGATLGGAIKKDRAFFFASYEGYRLAIGVPNNGRVPTPAELGLTTGGQYLDFSADPKVINPVPVLGPLVTLPTGATAYASETYKQATCGTHVNAFCVGAPVNPGDAVADPTAVYMAQVLHYFPTPNVVTANPQAINYISNGKASTASNQETLRVDYNLGDKNKLFGRYTRFDRGGPSTQFFNNPGGPQGYTQVGSTVSQYVAGDSYTLSPSSLLDLRASYLRYFSFLQPQNTNFNLPTLDNGDASRFWTGAAPQLRPYFPDVSITGNAPAPYSALNQSAQQPLDVYDFTGTLTKVLGRHSVSFGGEFRYNEQYFFNNPFLSGFFVFAGTQTACIPSGATSSTFNDVAHVVLAKNCAGGPVIPASGATPVADFVSGQYAAAPVGFYTTKPVSSFDRYGGVFVNDTFTLSTKLTITAGVRYEKPGAYLEKNDNFGVLIPGQANPLVLVNSSGYSNRGDLVSHNTLFSPRLGFSFQPYAGTTFRAGYSLAYIPMSSSYQTAPSFGSINTVSTYAPPSYQLCAPLGLNGASPNTGSLTACNTAGVTAKSTILQPQTRASYAANPTQFYGQNIGARVPFGTYPYLQQYNFNLQQAFGASTVVQLAYLGARGEHLPLNTSLNINQLPDNVVVNPATAQAARPYSLFQSVNEFAPQVAESYYNSGQATLTKRFRSGGTLLGNYSWSKFLSNTDSYTNQTESHSEGLPQDNYNLRGERSYLSFDVPQRLVVSYILDLPVGTGKQFLSHAGPGLNRAVGGWNVSGINTLQSGFPLAIIAPTNLISAAFGGGTPRPNYIPGCNQKANISYVQAAQTGASIFNTACFTIPANNLPANATTANYFGNQPRTSGILRSQGTDNWDFSIGKNTPLHEGVNLVFRAEAFNVANRVQFGDPGLTASGSSFGVLSQEDNSQRPRSMQFSLRVDY